MQRKLAEHRVPLLSDPQQIRYVYIMAFDDTSGDQRFQPDGKHSFREMGEGGGSVLPGREPQA